MTDIQTFCFAGKKVKDTHVVQADLSGKVMGVGNPQSLPPV